MNYSGYNPYGYLPQGILGFDDIYMRMLQNSPQFVPQQQPQGILNQNFSAPTMLEPNLAPVAMQEFGMTIDQDAKKKGKDFLKDLFSGRKSNEAGQFDKDENYIKTDPGFRANEQTPGQRGPVGFSPENSMYQQAMQYLEEKRKRERNGY